MPDRAGAIARMLFDRKDIFGDNEPDDYFTMVDLILCRWPNATVDEVERGFRIAIELGQAEAHEATVSAV